MDISSIKTFGCQIIPATLKLGALGSQKLGLIEMQFNSNQVYLSIYASHVVKADKQKGQKLEEYIEVEVH